MNHFLQIGQNVLITVAIVAGVSIASALIFLVVFTLTAPRSATLAKVGKNFVNLLLYGTPAVLCGFIAGYVSGLSRTGVVGNLVPAVLAGLGGLMVYVFGSDTRYKTIVGYCITLFVLSVVIGLEHGSALRIWEREQRLAGQFEMEMRLRDQRRNLGLDLDKTPTWLPSDDAK